MYSFSSQHRDICEFPSFMFYEDKLRTSSSVDDRDKKVKRTKEFLHFWPCHKDKDYVPLVFCHVAGEERELAVTTEQGNQRSKSNLREKDKVVSLNSLLVNFFVALALVFQWSAISEQWNICGASIEVYARQGDRRLLKNITFVINHQTPCKIFFLQSRELSQMSSSAQWTKFFVTDDNEF